MEATMSRRDFFGTATLGSVALGLSTAPFARGDEPADSEQAWDDEYDVVVLGLGGAGANTAIAAYEDGAKVLVCEKAGEGEAPCNTNAAGQNIIATEDADALYSYFSQLMGKFTNYDEEALRALADGCTENFSWVIDMLGADPEVVCPREDPTPEVGPNPYHWDLAENPWGLGRPGYVVTWDEFPEIPESASCKNILVNKRSFDASYYNLLMDNISRREGDMLTVWRNCTGEHLVTDGSGAVTGVIVNKEGNELRIKANGGVVLCTGGYEASPEMISDFTQMPYVYCQAGTTNTGDGVRMAAEVGAQLWHMSNVAGWACGWKRPNGNTCVKLDNQDNGVWVGLNGARFMNENATNRHGRISFGGRWVSTPLSLPTYYIVDSEHLEKKLLKTFSDGNVDEIANGTIMQADSIESLVEQVRALSNAPDFNANGELDDALAKYNAHCHANNGEGEVDDFGRLCTNAVEVPPFYFIEFGATMANTQGGPRRNQFAQVLNWNSLPIPGLFSAGELGSVFADMYNGGGNLAETMVFGRLAGRNAAARARGEFEGATEPALTHQDKLELASATEEAANTALSGNYADGTYKGIGQGYGSNLTLSVTVENGAVSLVEVVSSRETPEIGGQALPSYCEQIVETQDLGNIDIVAGASTTLAGFKMAIQDALSQAQG